MSQHYADGVRTWAGEESAFDSAQAWPERFHSQAKLRSDQFGAVPVLDASRPCASPTQSQQIIGDNLFLSFGGKPAFSNNNIRVGSIPEEGSPEGPRLIMDRAGRPDLGRVPSSMYFGMPPTDPRLSAPGSVQRMSTMNSAIHSERIVIDAGMPPDYQTPCGSPPELATPPPHGCRLEPPASERGLVDACPGSPFLRFAPGVAALASSGSLPTPPMTAAGPGYPTYGTDVSPVNDPLQQERLALGMGMGMLDRGGLFNTPPQSPETAAVLDARGEVSGFASDPMQHSVWSFTNEVQDQTRDDSRLNAEIMGAASMIYEPDSKQEKGVLPEKSSRRPPLYQAAFREMELDVAQLEGIYLQKQQNHMDSELAILERIAGNIVTIPDALDDWDPEEEPVWRAGTREWQSRFTTEALNGFWIDKTRIASREEHLWKLRRNSQQNALFDVLAGVPVDRKKKHHEALENMSWRGLATFDPVDDDDFAYLNREPGGDCAGRPVRPETAPVLTF